MSKHPTGGATLGPPPGIIAGWPNAGTYLFYGVVTSVAAGRFINGLVSDSGLWPKAPDFMAYIFAWVALAVVWLLASRQAKGGTRALLVVETVTVTLILVVTVIVLIKLLSASAPGQSEGLQAAERSDAAPASTVTQSPDQPD